MDPDAVSAYAATVKTLATDLEQWASDPARLLISPDAATLLLAFENNLEPRLAPYGDLGVIADWGSKAAGQTIRLAGLLHLAKGNAGLFEPIEAATMRDAITLIGYYTAHAKAAFITMGSDEVTTAATYVLNHLKREHVSDFTVRDLHSKLGTNRFPKVDDLKSALDLLEDHYWIACQPEPEHRGPGRKPSRTYITLFTESTETEPVESASSVTKDHAP